MQNDALMDREGLKGFTPNASSQWNIKRFTFTANGTRDKGLFCVCNW